MKTATIVLLLHCSALLVAADAGETRDLDLDIDSEDLERKHKHKKRKKQQQFSPCGRTFGFGDKLFGQPDYTYINAPVNNYYIGCGGASQHAPPAHQHSGHGGHGSHGGHGGHGSHGGQSSHGNQGFGGQQFGGFNGFPQQSFSGGNNQGYYQQNSPVQSAVSAAATSFGSALADYITRPRKAQRQINQILRPLYRLF